MACNLIEPRWIEYAESAEIDDVREGQYAYFWEPRGGQAIKPTDTQAFPFVSDNVADVLARMNDDGLPFSEIADWIERYL